MANSCGSDIPVRASGNPGHIADHNKLHCFFNGDGNVNPLVVSDGSTSITILADDGGGAVLVTASDDLAFFAVNAGIISDNFDFVTTFGFAVSASSVNIDGTSSMLLTSADMTLFGNGGQILILTPGERLAISGGSFEHLSGDVGFFGATAVPQPNSVSSKVALESLGLASNIVEAGAGYLEQFRKKGSGGILGKRWQISGASTAATTTTVPSLNQMYVSPLLSGPGGTLDDLAFENTTVAGAGGVARIGIYSNLVGDTYPDALLFDSGSIATDVAANIKQVNGVGVNITPDTLYWLVLMEGVAICTLRSIAASAAYNFWATDIAQTSFTSALNHGLFHAQAYGALPGTFPTTTPVFVTSLPLMAYTLV